MISMECLVRVFECSFLYCFKAWILTISPILGYSVLPSPFQCYIGSLLTYLGAVAASIFSLLTNFLRWISKSYSQTFSGIHSTDFYKFLRSVECIVNQIQTFWKVKIWGLEKHFTYAKRSGCPKGPVWLTVYDCVSPLRGWFNAWIKDMSS